MENKSRKEISADTLERAGRISIAIADLEAKIRQIEASGTVAPPGCYVARYQARGYRGVYWYYKLQANSPIFPQVGETGKLSRYKHLGKAGSLPHVQAVMEVSRRVQIDELSATIKALQQSWTDLYPTSQNNEKIT